VFETKHVIPSARLLFVGQEITMGFIVMQT
jgi:hypothetical protein